jgi:tRNA modification GTPase
VIRISGDTAAEALKLTVPDYYEKQVKPQNELKPRYAHFRRMYNVFSEPPRMIDEGLVLYFKAPHSFTGEDMVELQVHGGNAVKS